MGNFPWDEYPYVGQRVGQTRFEFEINHWGPCVNHPLVLQKSFLHPSLEKYGRWTRNIFFFAAMMCIKKLGLHLKFLLQTVRFYPCL